MSDADAPAIVHHAEPASRPAKVVMAAGWVVVAIGAFGAAGHIHHFGGTVPWRQLARWMVLLAVGHDLVLAPLVCLVALLIGRFVPRSIQGKVAGAAIVSGPVILMAVPAVREYGAVANNPSILPGHYGTGLLMVLAWVWGAALLAIVVSAARARRR